MMMGLLDLQQSNSSSDYSIYCFGSPTIYYALTCLFTLGIIYYRSLTSNTTLSKLPEFNPREWFDITNIRRIRKFMRHSLETLTAGRAQFQDRPYRLYCEWGEQIVLSPKDVDGIKGDRRLEFRNPAIHDFHGYLPEFEGFSTNKQLPSVITKHLTKPMAKLIAPLSEEASLATQELFTDSSQWQDFESHNNIMSLVSRMSSRIFMGVSLCRDDGWNRASMLYVQKAFPAGDLLSEYPRWARPIAHWFMPSCWSVGRALTKARKYLKPYLDRRRQLKRESAHQEDKVVFDDAIEWFEQEFGKHDPAAQQIGLSVVAMHTTTDLLRQTCQNIALHPELFNALRQEIINVVGQQGLTKAALYSLKLMDSVVKESQRLKPVFLGGFRREAMEDMTLPNGMFLKKGSRILVDSTHMWNSDYYEDAQNFDGYRFLRIREGNDKQEKNISLAPAPRQELKSTHAHLVSTSVHHFGFGHGKHACPGRFFAANVIKIALCHLLLKYDWKVQQDAGENRIDKVAACKPIAHGMSYLPNTATKLSIRRREEEIDLARLEAST